MAIEHLRQADLADLRPRFREEVQIQREAAGVDAVAQRGQRNRLGTVPSGQSRTFRVANVQPGTVTLIGRGAVLVNPLAAPPTIRRVDASEPRKITLLSINTTPFEYDFVRAAKEIDAKAVGIALYGPYLLAVELASMLLLAGLVAAYHIGKNE